MEFPSHDTDVVLLGVPIGIHPEGVALLDAVGGRLRRHEDPLPIGSHPYYAEAKTLEGKEETPL